VFYTYLIWNKETKMKYIGYHKDKNDMNDYYGTPVSKRNRNSLEFQRILLEDRSSLKKRVLQWFDTAKEAIAHEIELHDRYDVARNEMYYNARKQTATGFNAGDIHWDNCMRNRHSKKMKELGIKPPSADTWWTEEHSKRQSERMKGNTYKLGVTESKETKERKVKAFAKSKTHSAHLKNISEETRKKRSINMKKRIEDGFDPMRDEENRKKVSEAKKGLKKLKHPNLPNRMAKPGSEKWNLLLSQGYE
jgi:hypothetical protein